MKPTLYLNDTLESKRSIQVIRAGNFPHVVDLDPPSYINAPCILYEKKIIKGFSNIEKAVEDYQNSRDLHKVFFPNIDEDIEDKPKKRKRSLTGNQANKKEMAFALVGYLLGGLWIISIDLFIQLTPMVQVVLLLLIPVGILGWPYYYPYIKEQIKNSQEKSRKS